MSRLSNTNFMSTYCMHHNALYSIACVKIYFRFIFEKDNKCNML